MYKTPRRKRRNNLLLKIGLDLAKAIRADPLSLKLANAENTAAEGAGGVILGKDYSVSLYKDLNGIVAGDVHLLSHLLGDNYSSELVNVSDYSCRFHIFIYPFEYVKFEMLDIYILAQISFIVNK